MKGVMIVMVLFASVAVASDDKYAPLPERIMNAKTVFIRNETGIPRFGDGLYQELRKWNRWEVVGDQDKAELMLVLSQSDTFVGTISTANVTATSQSASGTAISAPVKSSAWYLHIVDLKTGKTLWTTKHTLGGRLWQSWGSVARSLLSDVQKRMK